MSKKCIRKGSILVFALVIMSFVLITALSVASVALIERRGAIASMSSTTAFQNADKGMEDFLQQLYNDMEQSETLNNMASRLNVVFPEEGYECKAANGNPAYIGNDETEYIIYAYKEGGDVQGGDSGWTSAVAITDCNVTKLADVSRFKITGNHNNAVRAVFVKLRDSLTRDLIAHWSFEDRAQVDVLLADTEETFSMTAQDASKNSHILTLCNFENTVDIKDESNNDLGQVVEFPSTGTKICGKNTDFMNPKKQKSGPLSEADEKRYSNNGAWVKGIVNEGVDVTDPGDPHSEALYFDGNDFLAMYVDSTNNNCEDEYNCVKVNQDKLQLTDGITISLWMQLDDVNPVPQQTLISRHNGTNRGFQLYRDTSGKICFKINNDAAQCSDSSVSDKNWHYVVASWQSGSDSNKLTIIVDDKSKSGGDIFSISNNNNSVLYIGSSNGTSNYFKGIIDDIRIWDRKLTVDEIKRLCKKSQIGVTPQVACLP